MKKIAIVFVVFIAIATIIVSKNLYDQKLKATATEAKQLMQENIEQEIQSEKEEAQKERLRLITENMDDAVAELVIGAVGNNEEIKIVITGSSVLEATAEMDSWPDIFMERLDEAYGHGVFSVEVVSYGDKGSYEVLHEKGYHLVVEKSPDILVIEPLLLNDNGITRIEDTLKHLDRFIDEVREVHNDIVVIVQPPQPIFQPSYYLTQVTKLEEHSLAKGYLYFDHWDMWPSIEDEALNEYILDDQRTPNEDGHHLWANFVSHYFISE
ncbi:hypothetical protein BKP45_06805 [Anaerobacillus alkalidiazotrophicus]|uniref:SGNH hydrolase-type esterase domain-containing protein n=1 Tax=Anaerobacillus alkalidiazotrophicus TaxID=472963 RepID=A0A1S2MC21_9BACI|nr:SGNH/GDSL hydrolase family protein [Anaerobacillus alkalidiazotrophicus]OIJ22342.1 hypothetical protein BKP45_06805 [Anaerobacillus alkalidiazotrophicus]